MGGTTTPTVTQTPVLGNSCILSPSLVVELPTCTVNNIGWRGMVTNATKAFTAGIGLTVVGGGANIVPVVSDGTNWKIG